MALAMPTISAECELGMPPVDSSQLQRRLLVRKYSTGTLMICADPQAANAQIRTRLTSTPESGTSILLQVDQLAAGKPLDLQFGSLQETRASLNECLPPLKQGHGLLQRSRLGFEGGDDLLQLRERSLVGEVF